MTNQLDVPAWLDRRAYPFAHRWFALASGTRVHYVDEGSGPTLLFVHGTPTWSFEWREQIKALAPRFRCVALDLVGMGLSDRPADFAYTPEAHAAALLEFVNGLDLRDFTLIVHDFGGPIGLPLALENPSRVKRFVALNTFGWSLDDDPDIRRPASLLGGRLGSWLYKYANLSLRVIMPSAFADRRKLTPDIHRQYLLVFQNAPARGTVLHGFARALLGSSPFYRDIGERLGALRRIPVLIIWGTKDKAFRETQLDRWIAALPHARVVRLPVGHWPQEEAPAEVSAALQSFLEEVPVSPAVDAEHAASPTTAHLSRDTAG
jgi:pimeloyl-ACP methyl ester carboxylesterase